MTAHEFLKLPLELGCASAVETGVFAQYGNDYFCDVGNVKPQKVWSERCVIDDVSISVEVPIVRAIPFGKDDLRLNGTAHGYDSPAV